MHKKSLTYLSARSKIIFAIESLLQEKNYISVHTPSLSPWLIPERHIDVFEVERREQVKNYLVPSPEIHIKQLLAEWALSDEGATPSVYEFAHAFRKEQVQNSLVHSDEFLMLECYTNNASLDDSHKLCQDILIRAKEVAKSCGILELLPVWTKYIESCEVMDVAEYFERFAGINLDELIACATGSEALAYANISNKMLSEISTDTREEHYDWEDVFHFILVDRIEPQLPKDRPVYLWHYPSRVDTLAQKHEEDEKYSERWELYIGGVEIANCYVEERNPETIKSYMQRQQGLMNSGHGVRRAGIPYKEDYLQHHGLKKYSGIALGVDRLIMCLLGASGLGEVSTLGHYH